MGSKRVPNLDQLKVEKKKLEANLRTIKKGLVAEQDKLAMYDKEIAKAELMEEMDLDGAEFDIDMLKSGRKNIVDNIEQIKLAVVRQEDNLKKCEQEIGAAEAILGLHAKNLICKVNGEHDWEILDIFPMSRNWKKRRCRICGTEERLGHN